MSDGEASAAAGPARLRSLDALRGFDMLWITGGREVVAALAASTGLPLFIHFEAQLHHAPWHGFTLWDLVFPLFLFVSGATLPFSQDRRLEAGVSRGELAGRIARRVVLLVLLGAVYNGLLTFDLAHQRWASVLGRIGLGWGGAALIALWVGVRGRALAALAILVGYGALLAWWPVPAGAGTLVQGRNVVDLFDQRFLPGRLHRGDHDPEGLLATLPAVATALLGALAGARLRAVRRPRARTAAELALAGAALASAGWLLGLVQPLTKALWTPSFTLVTAGYSALALGLFHLLVDVPAERAPGDPARTWSARVAFPFVVLGANAITLYLLDRFIAFDALAALLFEREPARLAPPLVAFAAVVMRWLCLWWLWRRRLFLRV